MKDKTLVVAYTEGQASELASAVKKEVKKGSADDFVIVALTREAQHKFLHHGLTCKIAEDYLSREAAERVDVAAFAFAKDWYSKGESQGSFSYENIELGSLAEYDMTLFYVELIKNIEITQQIISSEKPTRIIAYEDPDRSKNVSVAVATSLGIEIQRVNPTNIASLKQRLLKDSLSIDLRPMGRPITLRIPEPLLRFLLSSTYFFEKTRIGFARLGSKKLPSKSRVLMLNFNPTEYPCLFNELKENDFGILLVNSLKPLIWNSGAMHDLLVMNIEYRTIGDYVNGETKRNVGAVKESLLSKWDYLRNDEDFRKSHNYQGVEFWDLIEDKYSFLFSEYYVELVRYIEAMKRLINTEQIDAVVSWNDVLKLEKTVATLCKQMDVPTIVIQHGVTGHPIGYLPVTSDRMAVWGETSRRWLLSHGVPEDKLVVTGNTKFDLLNRFKNSDKQPILRKLNLSFEKGLIVFATQPTVVYASNQSEMEKRLLFQMVIQAMEQFPDKQLVVKLHPVDDGKIYGEVAKKTKRNIAIIKDINIYELISACDILMAVDSTVLLEGLMLDKPIIIINPSNRRSLYSEYHVAFEVNNKDELVSTIRDVLSHRNTEIQKAREKFVYEYAHIQDGKASERVVSLLEQLIHSKYAS